MTSLIEKAKRLVELRDAKRSRRMITDTDDYAAALVRTVDLLKDEHAMQTDERHSGSECPVCDHLRKLGAE